MHFAESFESEFLDEGGGVETGVDYAGVGKWGRGRVVGRVLVVKIEGFDVTFEDCFPGFGQSTVLFLGILIIVLLHLNL